jgi:anthranilate/para-aminobenzoate synthase component I
MSVMSESKRSSHSLFAVPGPGLVLKASGTYETSWNWKRVWADLAAQGTAVFLESAGPVTDASRWSILAGLPQAEVWGTGTQVQGARPASFQEEIGDVWDFLDNIGKKTNSFGVFPQSLSQAWFGAFSYEFANPLSCPAPTQRPDFYFFKPGKLWVIDRLHHEWTEWGGAEGISRDKGGSKPFRVEGLRAHLDSVSYGQLVESAKNYIAQGDIYQANLAQKFTARWEGEPLSLYRLLAEVNPGPFMGLFKNPLFTLVSSSPERLIRGRGTLLETRPIAGTRPRGLSPQEDVRLKQELQTSPKELAEHLMLVDLMRNDLGRVARYGTVEVKDYARVESYAKVHHLVSTVEAQSREDVKFSQAFRSVFPGGTITGCPKIRCMQIIDELERIPRHFYTGSLGYLAPGPVFDFNILIRSFTLWPEGGLEFFAGAGIVADSDPQREYLETLHKVEALAQALGTSLVPA